MCICMHQDRTFCFDKNYNNFQTTRFNHTMIFFKLFDKRKLSDIYISHNNCLGHMLITQLLQNLLQGALQRDEVIAK